MFDPVFGPHERVAIGQSPLQIGLPGSDPNSVVTVFTALFGLLIWVVAVWMLVRIARYCWSRIAGRVRYDERGQD